MVYIRGQREDYDHWAELGNEGWSYADVLPYFRRSEDNERFANAYHGQGGPLWVSDQIGPHELSRAFVRACQGWGLPYNPDFNGAEQYGAGFYQVTCRHGRRRSAAVSYLWPVLSRPNLTVLTHARAVKIPIENGRAIGVEIARKGSITTARCRREVIVSSGAINSPRLLILLSYSFFQIRSVLSFDILVICFIGSRWRGWKTRRERAKRVLASMSRVWLRCSVTWTGRDL